MECVNSLGAVISDVCLNWAICAFVANVTGLIGVYVILKIRSANGELDEAVNYQVISAKDLVGSVFTRGGWSNFLVWFLLVFL